MKYCRKCGMLLEDTCNTCIRCGQDVTIAENVSSYPLDVLKTLDAQKDEQKKRAKIIVLIVALFVVLAVLVAVAAVAIEKGNFSLGAEVVNEQPEETVQEAVIEEDVAIEETVEEVTEETAEAEENTIETDEAQTDTADEPRTIKDDKGSYYRMLQETDDVGNVVFNAIYPEDFDSTDFQLDYDTCSTKIPMSFQFVATGEDGGVSFLYYSPKHYWYKASETGKTRANERDITNRMSFLEYVDARSYIESILKESYKGAKIDLVNEEEVSDKATEAIKDLSEQRSKALFGKIGDYANIGENTTYANMDASYSAEVYEYEITMPDKQMIFDKFYVPVIANNLYYANDSTDDRGTVTEWYCLGVIGFEAGSEDIRDDYLKAFDIFMSNCVPSDTFIYINQLYSEEVTEAIKASRAADPMTAGMLTEYTSKAQMGIELNDTNKAILKVLKGAADKCFTADGISIYADDKDSVVFVSKDKDRVFVSGEEDEYPGDDYLELFDKGQQGDETLNLNADQLGEASGSAEQGIDKADEAANRSRNNTLEDEDGTDI